MTGLGFFLALKIQNVNNNNFKKFGYQTKCEHFAVFSYLNSTLKVVERQQINNQESVKLIQILNTF